MASRTAKKAAEPKPAAAEPTSPAADEAPPESGPEAPATDESPAQPALRNVVEAIVAVMRDVRAVGKDGRNTQSNYNFRGIDGTVNALGPAMRKHGLLCVPHRVREFGYGEVEVGKNRTKQAHVQVGMTYRFLFSNPDTGDISTLDVEVPGEAMDSGDKATAKAMSVAYRTCLLQSFSLPTQERDPDADTHERSATLTGVEVQQLVADALEKAEVEGRDPIGELKVVWDSIGERALAEVQIQKQNGHVVSGSDYINGWVAHIQKQRADEQEAAQERARQDAVEGPTRDVHADERAQEPDGARAPEADAHAQGAPAGRAPEAERPAEARAMDEQVARDQQQQGAGVNRLFALLRDEIEGQAHTLGIHPSEHVASIVHTVKDARGIADVPPARLHRWVAEQRSRVIAALREQGLASQAEAYASVPANVPGKWEFLTTPRETVVDQARADIAAHEGAQG